jgi:hypothetical protein
MVGRFLIAVIGLWLGTASLFAQEETPLAQFSADSSVVVRLRAPDKSIAAAAEFLDSVQSGLGKQAAKQFDAVGSLISNPQFAGVDRSRDWYAVVFDEERGSPNVVFAIPAVDSKAMIKALPSGFRSRVKGKWVIYTDKALPVEAKEAKSISDSMSRVSQEMFMGGEVGVYFNVPRLAERYKKELKDLEGQAVEAMKGLPQRFGQEPARFKLALSLSASLLGSLGEAVGDAEDLVVMLMVAKPGAMIQGYGSFRQGSPTTERMAGRFFSTMGILDRLPEEAVGYLGVAVDMQKLLKWVQEEQSMAGGDDPRSNAMEGLADRTAGIKCRAVGYSFDIGDRETGLLTTVTAVEAQPAEEVKSVVRSYLSALGQGKATASESRTRVDLEAESIGESRVDVVTVEKQAGGSKEAMVEELLFRGEGATSRIAFTDEGFLKVSGGGKAAMASALARFRETATGGRSSAYQGIALPASNLTWMFDLPSFVLKAVKAAPSLKVDLPIKTVELEKLGITSSFLGGSAVVMGNEFQVRFALPVKQARNIAKLVTYGMKNREKLESVR